MNSVFIKAIFESCLPLYLTRENNLQQEAKLSLSLRDDSSERKLWIHRDIRSFEHLRFLFINKLYNNRLSAFSMTETYPWRNPGKYCGFLVSMVTECHAPLFTQDLFFVNYNKGAQWSFWHPWSVLADGYLSHLAQLRVAGIQHTIEQLCKLALYICIDWLAS